MSGDGEGLEKPAKYIVRAPISQERMLYISSVESANCMAQVIYIGKKIKLDERFTALDWLARLVSISQIEENNWFAIMDIIPTEHGERAKRRRIHSKRQIKDETSNTIPHLMESSISKKVFRKNWARLIKKVYNTDPLVCPKCNSAMRRRRRRGYNR